MASGRPPFPCNRAPGSALTFPTGPADRSRPSSAVMPAIGARPVNVPSVRFRHRRLLPLAALTLLALVTPALAAGAQTTAPAAGPATFTAVGSVEQVYVTGLAPNSQATLITPTGKKLATQSADSLGGLLFRNVP